MLSENLTCLVISAQDPEKMKAHDKGKAGRTVKYDFEDVAGALARLNPSKSAYARAYITREIDDNAIMEYLLPEVRRIGRKWRCPKDRPHFIRELADLAVYEKIDPNPCKECKGIGSSKNEHTYHECHKCKGSGLRGKSMIERAEDIEIPATTFRYTWNTRYHQILSILDQWERDINVEIKKSLGRF